MCSQEELPNVGSPDAPTVLQGTYLSPQPSTHNDETHLVSIPLAILSKSSFLPPQIVILCA